MSPPAPPSSARHLGSCSLGTQSPAAGGADSLGPNQQRANLLSAERLAGNQRPPSPLRPPRVASKRRTGAGKRVGACRLLGTVVGETAVRPWQNCSPHPAASLTRLLSVVAPTRIPAPRWAQNLLLPSSGSAGRSWGLRGEHIPRSARPGSGWVRTPSGRRCSSGRLGRTRVGQMKG